jgi:uncharacterized protein (TIGR00369 family)
MVGCGVRTKLAMPPTAAGVEPVRIRAEIQSTCFVCGPAHPSGLRIRYEIRRDGSVCATWTPGRSWEGFAGIIHGGIVSTLLDEAMSKAVSAAGRRALTAELRVRFRHPVYSGEAVTIRGWVLDHAKRRIRTEAMLADGEGKELAHAWATFLPVAEADAGQ